MDSDFGASLLPLAAVMAAEEAMTNLPAPPRVPEFSVNYMDRAVGRATNVYEFADGQWLKDNPVPLDKARWKAFSELAERN